MSDLPERICIWEADKSDPNSTRGWTVSFPDAHPNIYVRASGNTLPAAPVDGVETVAYVRSNGDVVKFRDGWLFDDTDPLVTRSQAEAIIAAERAEKDAWMKSAIDQQKQAKRLKEHNAAQVARVKELEELLRFSESGNHFADNLSKELRHTEAQLAAANKALEEIDRKAQAGLCAGSFQGARAFHEDIRIKCAALEAKP